MDTNQEQSGVKSELDRKAESINSTGLFEVKPVGPNTISAISIMGEHEKLAGNVLRRMCTLGGEACAKTCALHQGIVERAEADLDAKCADENLSQVMSEMGIYPENVLMVGVGKDSIGFADEVDANQEKYAYATSPVTGAKEMAGYDAFFAREGDTIGGSEIYALGRRLADCGDINLEFTDKDGKRVMGFMHMSKPNLQPGKYIYDNRTVGSFEYWLLAALEHYQANTHSVKIRVAAAIKPEHYLWTFEDQADMARKGFEGWENIADDNGLPKLLHNKSDPDWQPGKAFVKDAEWQVDFRGMINWQMEQVKDLSAEQVEWEGAIDPGDSHSEHASNFRGRRNPGANGRDAYFTIWAEKMEQKLES